MFLILFQTKKNKKPEQIDKWMVMFKFVDMSHKSNIDIWWYITIHNKYIKNEYCDPLAI